MADRLESSRIRDVLSPDNVSRVLLSVRGVVQGVGFRPFVYQLATRYGLKGWVCNTSGDVKIDVEGDSPAVERFLVDLKALAPPLARIEGLTSSNAPFAGYHRFKIRESVPEDGKYQLVSPDIATCKPCLQETLDPADRRYRYPFTNCTNCGPRFTIIEDIPYDRPKTTMRVFKMCPRCQHEYEDPLNRRFHAQPNACPVCGPTLLLVDNEGNPLQTDDPVSEACRLLRQGRILAIKGLGGFLLACDATNHSAVDLLRQRKRRPSKPFAIMAGTIEEVKRHCHVSRAEEELLLSHQSPIVLLLQKGDGWVSPGVAPRLSYLGVMLPYTPLHHLLLREAALPLVMTSGNLSEEPIARDNDEALRRLKYIADYFLMHNRDIYARYDDSVAIVDNGKTQLVRRARGYAPNPIRLPFKMKQTLACGAELKNTFCLTRDDYAFLSQHIGDLENLETLQHYESTIQLYQKLFRISPEVVAYDMHPEYLSTKYAMALREKAAGIAFVPVQHHHAHIASCLADNGVTGPVIGVAFDGTGYGTDGRLWGGEFLVADFTGCRRAGQFQYVPLPGGAAAIQRPYRMAISYLVAMQGKDALKWSLPLFKDVGPQEIETVVAQIEKGLNSPLTSSCGRLFDAVSALIGVRGRIDYEAQAAIELEMLADESETGSYPFSIVQQDSLKVVRFQNMFSRIARDVRLGVSQGAISMKFHRTLAQLTAKMCCWISAETGLKQAALSGGVFQNRLLFRLTLDGLEQAGFQVLTHRQVPANDGGVSLGQAIIANLAAGERN